MFIKVFRFILHDVHRLDCLLDFLLDFLVDFLFVLDLLKDFFKRAFSSLSSRSCLFKRSSVRRAEADFLRDLDFDLLERFFPFPDFVSDFLSFAISERNAATSLEARLDDDRVDLRFEARFCGEPMRQP